MFVAFCNNFIHLPFASQNFVFWVIWHADLAVAPAAPVVPAGHAVHVVSNPFGSP